MEFYAFQPGPCRPEDLQALSIGQLPRLCASIDRVLADQGETGEIYCLWGQFRIRREAIAGGVRLSLPGCPNALAWTLTCEQEAGRAGVRVHLTINRPNHEPDFIESIEVFVEDWRQGLEGWLAPPDGEVWPG